MHFDPALAAQDLQKAEATRAPVKEALSETRSTDVQCDLLMEAPHERSRAA